MLEIKDISKTFGKNFILKKMNFTIPGKSITGIIGPNGAGKTTLLKILTGFWTSDTGTVLYQSRELNSFEEKKRLFSYMPEDLQIYPEYYVKDFITFIHNINGFQNNTALNVLQLSKVMDKKIKHLSKGFHQRLKLYFALCNNKKIAVLDEPFDGFDPIQLCEIIKLIKSENDQGKTFIMCIHQLYDAEKLCNNYILIDEGQIIAKGNLKELTKQYGKKNKHLEDIFINALK